RQRLVRQGGPVRDHTLPRVEPRVPHQRAPGCRVGPDLELRGLPEVLWGDDAGDIGVGLREVQRRQPAGHRLAAGGELLQRLRGHGAAEPPHGGQEEEEEAGHQPEHDNHRDPVAAAGRAAIARQRRADRAGRVADGGRQFPAGRHAHVGQQRAAGPRARTSPRLRASEDSSRPRSRPADPARASARSRRRGAGPAPPRAPVRAAREAARAEGGQGEARSFHRRRPLAGGRQAVACIAFSGG
ncbi:unnamed protein product, partial [Prorocentrum cordatum]